MEWAPEHFVDDPMVNAVLNMAAEISRVSVELDHVVYALKYSKEKGVSVAEAIEILGQKIIEAARG